MHTFALCFAGFARCMSVSAGREGFSSSNKDQKEVVTPLYRCAWCKERSEDCKMNGAANPAIGPRDFYNVRKVDTHGPAELLRLNRLN